MTKVKESNKKTSRQEGTTETQSKKGVGGSSEVTATRNGEILTFNRLTWDLLPRDKDGWEEVLDDSPKEPKQKEEEQETVDHVITQDDLDTNPEWQDAGHKVGETIKLPKGGI